ncbi:hypothetical protein [Kitasatospora fiedleri]|uniref:hypothetical protein n=1 Tax=Kitasatospora fiedleri TaxID=2991545 RepID=UPI002499B4F7|nr:hypothetical protein [Kitasatospora fiedleri]
MDAPNVRDLKALERRRGVAANEQRRQGRRLGAASYGLRATTVRRIMGATD